jgi:hypothetical protein
MPSARKSCSVLVGLLVLMTTGCVADPHQLQMRDLLDRLTAAHALFAEQPPRVDAACNVVGDVQTRLYGEPGLTEVQPAWPRLRDAADALGAVCGQNVLLAQPSSGAVSIEAARQRWRKGIEREMGVACEHLRAAAAALNRGAPC